MFSSHVVILLLFSFVKWLSKPFVPCVGGRGFVEVKEFGVPDTVKSMAWCGENICLGIRREYVILNSTNGALSEVFPSGRIAPPLVVSLASGELLLGKVELLLLISSPPVMSNCRIQRK
jgi:hypothetical protein